MALNINGTTGISGVDGSVSAPALTGTDSNTGITFPSADTIKFSTGGVERISITNSGISGTGISSGITMVDKWRNTSNFSGAANPLASNLSRATSSTDGYIGSAMTESSGIFTFPSTGIYRIEALAEAYIYDATNRYYQLQIEKSVDSGSSFTLGSRSSSSQFDSNTNTFSSAYSFFLFDVTNVSTHKIRFVITVANSSVYTIGDSTSDRTFFTFIRLGDT